MKREKKTARRPAPTDYGAADAPGRPAIERLVAAHLAGLTAFVRLRLGPLIRANESCADIVQSACREVLAHADRFQFDGDGNFRNWLFTTALRKITDKKRYYLAEKRRAPRFEGAADGGSTSEQELANCYQDAFTSPSQAAIKKEDVEGLEKAFDELSDEDREVVVMARILGLSHHEIAKETGLSPGAVRTRLSRALVRLAARMRKRGSGPRP